MLIIEKILEQIKNFNMKDYSMDSHTLSKKEPWVIEHISSGDLLSLIIHKYNQLNFKNNISENEFNNVLLPLMYIVEWKYALEFETKLTNIKWINKDTMSYDNFNSDLEKSKNKVKNNFVDPKKFANSINKCVDFALSKYIKFDFKYYKICYLCSCTYPSFASDPNGYVPNLVNLAKKYKKIYNYKKGINL